MTNNERMTKPQIRTGTSGVLGFVIRVSFGFRHSDFGFMTGAFNHCESQRRPQDELHGGANTLSLRSGERARERGAFEAVRVAVGQCLQGLPPSPPPPPPLPAPVGG